MSIVFATPGLIPLEAFTVFGATAKPNTNNPIGFFGTGLKIGIAVCLRMGQEVILYRGGRKYTFYVKQDTFRDKEFGFVYMKVQSWLGNLWGRAGSRRLPFTTELGKTWELWQAFREFEANTRDENGQTYLSENVQESVDLAEKLYTDQTFLVVNGQRFTDEWHDRGRTFLEDGLSQREGEAIQVIDRPTKHIYYRGMRVMDLKVESRYTYNFLKSIDLTEDRTAKYPFLIQSDIADLIRTSEDLRFVSNTVPTPIYRGPIYYEHSIPYTYADKAPSPAFLGIARNATRTEIREIWEAAQPIVPTKVHVKIEIPQSGLEDEEYTALAQRVQELYPNAHLVGSDGRKWQDPKLVQDATYDIAPEITPLHPDLQTMLDNNDVQF